MEEDKRIIDMVAAQRCRDKKKRPGFANEYFPLCSFCAIRGHVFSKCPNAGKEEIVRPEGNSSK